MSNFGIKINLTKVKSAFLTNLKGAKETKRCLVIPLDSTDVYEGEKGIYLNLAAFEMKEHKYQDTHLVKVSLEKEVYEALTEDERNNQPIIGSMRPIIVTRTQAEVTTNASAEPSEGDDLPF